MNLELDYWLKQTGDQPLFPDLMWSRPESKSTRGKLVIIGGNLHGFASVAEAYTNSIQSGIGDIRVILPDSLKSVVGTTFDHCEFTPSTPSGSFSQSAMATIIDIADWADGVLITGDLGRNSETLILIENFLNSYKGQLTLTNDALDDFTKSPDILLSRINTTIIIEFIQLQQLYKHSHQNIPLMSNNSLILLVKSLHDFSLKNGTNIITKLANTIFVCANGLISTTQNLKLQALWQNSIATKAAVWWLQNPNKSFEALSSSVCAD